ncbi:MAG: EAL domain-containing protein [Micromonosporaceae bacterium]|nr:EAL domain-containing protein [Micromonosporaceae bacterium]
MLDRLDGPAATEQRGCTPAAFRHEQQILDRLANIRGVSHPAPGSEPDGHITAGVTLADRLLTEPPLTAVEQVDIALSLARILTAVHRAGVTHGNLNAANVILHGQPVEISVIGFGHATTVAERQPEFSHHSALHGLLATLAPEQTGRTGRFVDQRADLYGLGVTLYTMATRALPFEETDPLRLIRDVLATVPVPPAERSPEVPAAMSAIIMRLLEKEPDQRYQSAEGLAHDLRRLRERPFIGIGNTGCFPLGEHDFPHRLSAPSRLAGRAGEIGELSRALSSATHGACRGVLVSGAPGVGKTALINELRPMVTALGGWFVSGKFDQYRCDLATDGVSQALRALGRLLLTEPETELLRHRRRLLAAVGPNASLLAPVQPELALVLGVPGDRRAEAETVHAQDRVVRAAIDVLRAIASRHRPVVVVLDDLQWAPATAIKVVDTLIQEEGNEGLLVVGAYRPGEIDGMHPLAAVLPRWRRLPNPPLNLCPDNLPIDDLNTMIGDMLKLPPAEALALATIVAERTGGNPFDTVALLNALREDSALVRDDHGWRWDETTIRRHVGEGDVVDLLATRIDRLPPDPGALLRSMACLGGEVDADLLCAAGGIGPEALAGLLEPALADGLLVLVQGDTAGRAMTVRFRHDRVQQAALSRLGNSQRNAMHLELARRLAAAGGFDTIAAEQYLPAAGEITQAEEQCRAVALFRTAASVLRLTNPAMTERFLIAALAVLDRAGDLGMTGREECDRVAVEISHHDALYHLGRLAEADERYHSIERLSPTPLQLAEAATVRISSLTFRERPGEAVGLGLDLLRRLGVDVPADDQISAWSERGMARMRAWAELDGLATDLTRDEASDPYGSAAANLISRMIPPAFFIGMPIMPWLVFECQRLWAEHGPCRALVGPLAHAGFVAVMMRENPRIGYAVNQRILTVCEARGHEPESSHARLLLSLSSAQWFEPLETVLEYAQHGLDGLIHGGDLQNAGFAAYVLIPTPLECTPTLDDYLTQVDERLAFAAESGNDQTYIALVVYRQLARSLLGRTEAPGDLSDASFDATDHLASQAGHPVASAYAHVVYSLVNTLFWNGEALLRHSAAAIEYLPYYEATLSTAIARLLRALALAETLRLPHPEQTPADRDAAIVELDHCHQWLASRAADAPGNFEHLLHFVDAELAWSNGDPLAAARAYDAALLTVRGRQRPWHAALIAERAAGFHFVHGLEHVGRGLLAEARDRYRAWGAVAKVRALESTHPFLRDTTISGRAPAPAPAETIDLLAILRACQALSSETSLGRLHSRVRDVLSAVTGATDVRIALRRDVPPGWFLLAEDVPAGTGADAPASTNGLGVPIDSAGGERLLPLSAFRYAERTLEPLLVADVACDSRFLSDPYLRERHCRSLLVVPILSHGTPRAVLILEHRLSGGAFTADRLGAIRLIAGQLAVSVENAIVYEELEERVRQRTCQLRQELAERQRTAAELTVAASVFHHALDGIVITGPLGRVISVNPTFTAITGYRPGDVLGRLAHRLWGASWDPGVNRDMRTGLIRDGRWEGEVWNRRKDGERILLRLSISRIDADEYAAERYVCLFHDITDLRRKDEHIRHLAFHDHLTGLPNQALLINQLNRGINDAQRKREPLGIFFIDLDRFKTINDSYGHDVGDILLKKIASRLRTCLRRSDVVARIGGDEFVVLMRQIARSDDYAALATKIINRLSQPARIANRDVQVGVSIGIACFPEDGADAIELMRHADAAMYSAKSAGRGTFCFFHAAMSERIERRLRLEMELRTAVRDQELELRYQPQVSLVTGEFIGLEALIRWRHRQHGLLDPIEFLPMAEEIGLSGELENWVLREAFRQSSTWRIRGIARTRIAINVSTRQVQRPDLLETIVDCSKRYDFPLRDLEIELTEGSIMTAPEAVSATLAQLRRLGATIAIDDFGTGYSSLAYLRRLPIDVLKIDRSFIMSTDGNPCDTEIVRTIVALGRTLNLTVVAEGVETMEQAEFLQACGCAAAQGYLFGRPMTADGVEGWIREHDQRLRSVRGEAP